MILTEAGPKVKEEIEGRLVYAQKNSNEVDGD